MSSLLNERSWAAIGSSLRCSRRELEILTSLIEDRLDTEDAIGRALGISPHTVHTHLERLYKKVGVASRAHLILRVFTEYVQLLGHVSPQNDQREPPRTISVSAQNDQRKPPTTISVSRPER